MEIILLGILIAIAIWFFIQRKSKKPTIVTESPEKVEAPYKIETPSPAPEVSKPIDDKVEATAPVAEPAAVEQKPAKKTKAKKAPVEKAPAKTTKKTVKSKADIRRVK